MLTLKEKGWITSLSAGGGTSGSNYREFSVGCSLTKTGLKHVDEIIQALFQTIRLVAEEGLAKWRYLEKRAVLESAFQFQETARSMDLVSHLVINMQHYDSEDIIYGDYVMQEYDEALLRSLLTYFTPENLRATLITKRANTSTMPIKQSGTLPLIMSNHFPQNNSNCGANLLQICPFSCRRKIHLSVTT